MQGKILDYNSEFKSGLIRGEDGNKYRFSIDDCKSAIKPRTNAEVDFEPSEDKAVEVYILTNDTIKDATDTLLSAAEMVLPTFKPSSDSDRQDTLNGYKAIFLFSIVLVLIIIISVK